MPSATLDVVFTAFEYRCYLALYGYEDDYRDDLNIALRTS